MQEGPPRENYFKDCFSSGWGAFSFVSRCLQPAKETTLIGLSFKI
jgi:hypothetical protein